MASIASRATPASRTSAPIATPACAVAWIRGWMAPPKATAPFVGSHDPDLRGRGRQQRLAIAAVELKLHTLAGDTGLRLAVDHRPLEINKWNKIEHRLFVVIRRIGATSRCAIAKPS